MRLFSKLIRVFLSPFTIIIVSHSTAKTIRLRAVPVLVLFLIFFVVLSFSSAFIYPILKSLNEEKSLRSELNFYKDQFIELSSTINSLKQAESQFERLFSLNSKEEIFESLDITDYGSIDVELIKRQIERAMNSIGEIRDYLRKQRDIYFATPLGYPVENAYISSPFGWREHPKTGKRDFHTGIDLAAWPGTPVKATADGIVVFAGWSGASGKLIVIKHGFGYTTCYAHNKKIVVKAGDIVKRGDIIAYVGSTGNTTGPHIHYEIWVDGKPVNPYKYLNKNVQTEDKQG